MGSKVLAGRYELIEKIGDGGMAVVYKAKDRALSRYVAIKILKPEFTKDIKFIENFRRESQAAASLSHPNIVNVYDVGREGNINYIVMELVEGEVLSDVIKQRAPLPPREAVGIARQVASALSHAHKNQIIHRDVKPHNILLTKDGTAKITDFGIAKAMNAGTIVSNTGTVMGSVHYFSPEQARGGYVDEKSDIYSLGIVLYEMLTGKVPFDAENPVAVAVMHMNDEIVPPSQLVPEIPPEVEEIVMKATNKYQVNRYKSADEMRLALEKANLSTMGIYSGISYDEKNLDATRVMQAVNRSGFVSEKPAEAEASDSEEEAGMPGKKEKEKKKKKINKVKVAAVILALVCAIPISQLILHLIEGGGNAEEVEVPYLIGMTAEQAEEELKKLGLQLKIDKEVYSATQEEGEIVSQDPPKGMMVKEGKTISVNISKGIKAGVIPNVIGKTLDEAKMEITDAGYRVGEVTEEESTMPEGVVIKQTPKENSEAEEGERIDLVVSKGGEEEEVEVPGVVGKSIDSAKNAIQKAGLTLNDIRYESSSAYDENHVIKQSPAKGTKVEAGSAVTLTVSTGPDPAAGPSTVNIRISYDSAPDEVFYLTVVVSDSAGVGTPIDYEQRLKSNGSEVLSVTGEGTGTVKVLFNNTLIRQYSVNFNTGAVN